MSTVSLHHVSTTSGDPVALNNFSLAANDRELLVLTGAADSGISHVLAVLAGLETPTAGEVQVDGKAVQTLPPWERGIALVSGSAALFPHLSVRENLLFGLKLRRFPKVETDRRLRDAAEILGLAELLDKKPDTLSAPERLRVAIGQAMVRQPRVYLFDEPLSMLEGRERLVMRAELARLHERLGAVFVYATGNATDALALGDRVAVLRGGALEQLDTPVRIYQQPTNQFVADFLAPEPMNFIRGILKNSATGMLFKEIGEGTVELKMEARPELVEQDGREVILGVRSENVRCVDGNEKADFRGLVDLVETSGAETLFHIDTGAHRLLCRVPGGTERRESGRRIQCKIALETICFFDPETGNRFC